MNRPIKFGSVCSGIEAASAAWHPLGWRAAWLAEIEPFPCAVLAHHYPDVPNLGDMTTIADRIRSGEVEAPDVFCGGTPCQAFSVAGLRKSLDDARGNLSLTFCEIANEIDSVRSVRGEPPAIVFWENVPGVLNTRDNAFGCFLAALAGEDEPLEPAGDKWTNAGCVFGPQRAVAWRVLDAQYFGVAQRRRRVFVVASARTGFDPAAVLFESDGVRRDIAPRRETGQETAGTLASRAGAGGFPGTDEACSGYVQPANAGCWWDGGQVSQTLDAVLSKGQTMPEKGRFPAVLQPGSAAVSVALRGRDGGATAELGDEVQNCLRASSGGGDKAHVLSEMAVRRLMPVEGERLMGFLDGYTAIPWRGKPADQCPDGPRYKALGNSWAIPCVYWIGNRIHRQLLESRNGE